MKFLLQIKPVYFFVFTFLLSFLMHLHVFNMDLVGYHVWRQTQTQLNIENFYMEDFNILNPRINDRGDRDGIQRLEFPIMQWLFACAYKLFGDHVIISRILSFIIGIFSVFGIFFLLKLLFHDDTMAMIGAWAFNFSPLFYYYTMNPLPDNFALCCSVWGLVFFFRWTLQKSFSQIILTGIFLSLGALAKLPFILYFSAPVAYFFFERKNISKYFLSALLLFVFILISAIWYIKVIAPHWHPVVYGIVGEKNISSNEILDILQHNLISTLPELLVNYGSMLFFMAGFYFIFKNKIYKKPSFKFFLVCSLLVLLYFLYELHIIAKVHDYYLFPFLPMIFIIVSYGCFHLLNSKNKFLIRLSVFLLLVLPLTAFLRTDTRWNIEHAGVNRNLLLYKNELRKAVPYNSLCVVGNDESKNIFFYYLNKRGWTFDHDELSSEKLKSFMNKGAKYLYSDSRSVDENNKIKLLLDSMILEKGSVRIYKLKNNPN